MTVRQVFPDGPVRRHKAALYALRRLALSAVRPALALADGIYMLGATSIMGYAHILLYRFPHRGATQQELICCKIRALLHATFHHASFLAGIS